MPRKREKSWYNKKIEDGNLKNEIFGRFGSFADWQSTRSRTSFRVQEGLRAGGENVGG